MNDRQLPHRPNLRQLRRQARERRRETHEPLQLAQHRLAQAYGFSNWAALKSTLDATSLLQTQVPPLLGKNELETLRDSGRLPSPAEILPALRHPNPKVRYECLGLLDHLADDACVPAILAATADPVPRVRRMAVHALGCQRCKPSELCADLSELLLSVAETDPVWRVRREAIISLVQQAAADRCAERLDAIAEADAHASVRKQAAWAARLVRGEGASWGVRNRVV
jgi:HEAT repeat protein